MDMLSNKVVIEFKLNSDKEIDNSLIYTNNRKLLADIEGELSIVINNRMFFQEKYVLLLEFGVILSNWLEDIDKGNVQSFIYNTMDYSESPLIEFNIQENSLWKIQSPWGQFQVHETFSLYELTNCSRLFLIEFGNTLKKAFNIDIADYLC